MPLEAVFELMLVKNSLDVVLQLLVSPDRRVAEVKPGVE